MAPVIKQLHEQMPEPKWVISMAHAQRPASVQQLRHRTGRQPGNSRGYLCAGVPPRPEALLYAILQLQEKISNERGSFKRALNMA